jgi:hypothetical protein
MHPACQVTVSFGNQSIPEIALLDSGAAGTTITKRVVSRLGLEQYMERKVSGATGVDEDSGAIDN